ncbi:histone-lysine N-methyltransferase set1 isoform X1 [Vespula maculifrons]|uniref:Uncharacterized protein n=2 Tax=Vespula TaxID=7451 RepID=A0A834JUY9_VESVU|nr:hypothetical protein HZH66_007834 [Vespula vulgaris]
MAVESASSSSSAVQFALGNEVSPHCHFFKSSFARSLVRNVRDSKSLDYELHDNDTIVEETSECNTDNRNNNFFSLLDFRYDKTITTTSTITTMNSSRRNNNERDTKVAICNTSVPVELDQSNVDMNELERLRKLDLVSMRICGGQVNGQLKYNYSKISDR